MLELTKSEKLVRSTFLFLVISLSILRGVYLNKPVDIVMNAIELAIFYYFAFKKPGTFLLALSIFGTILSILYCSYHIVIQHDPYFVIALLIDVIFLNLLIKLRRINISIQERSLVKLDLKIFNDWDKATSLNDLANKFLEAVEKFPTHSKSLDIEYQKRKKKFSMSDNV